MVVGTFAGLLYLLLDHCAMPVSHFHQVEIYLECHTEDHRSVYVAMPRIAQRGVDDTTIQLTDQQFLDPTPDSIVLTQSSILHSPSIYTPTLDPFNASLYLVTNGTYAATPMFSIPMPKIHALHPTSNITFSNVNVTITNTQELANFAIAALKQGNVTAALTGTTKLHEGKLPTTTVNYNTSFTFQGIWFPVLVM